jgi:hypothetical protein
MVEDSRRTTTAPALGITTATAILETAGITTITKGVEHLRHLGKPSPCLPNRTWMFSHERWRGYASR